MEVLFSVFVVETKGSFYDLEVFMAETKENCCLKLVFVIETDGAQRGTSCRSDFSNGF
jgi:hypothetical protein